MEKTAIEIFFDEIDNKIELYPSEWADLNDAFIKAKAMFRQQIEDAYGHGFMCDNITPIASDVKSIASGYYNNKYGG